MRQGWDSFGSDTELEDGPGEMERGIEFGRVRAYCGMASKFVPLFGKRPCTHRRFGGGDEWAEAHFLLL